MAIETNLGKVTFVPKGEWDETLSYERLNLVTDGNAIYVATKTVPAGTELTDDEYWMQIVGLPVAIGTVTDVAYDQGAAVTIGGTPDAPVLNFQIPRGVTGNESIDDSAGAGDTDVVWSANKIVSYCKMVMKSVGSSKSTGTAYEDLNTLPTNEYVYYGGSSLPEHCPDEVVNTSGSKGILVITISRNASGSVNALCPQILYFRVNKSNYNNARIFYRIPWGGSTTTWSPWYEVPVIDDTLTTGNNVVWSISKVKAELDSRLPDNFTTKNLVADIDTLTFEGSISPSSVTGYHVADYTVEGNKNMFFAFDSLTADGEVTDLYFRLTERDADENVTARNAIGWENPDKLMKFKTMPTTVSIGLNVFYQASAALNYTAEGVKLWQDSYKHEFTLSPTIYIPGVEETVPMSMFQKIGFIGDSYSSASIYLDEDTWLGRNFDLSWGQVLCREIGATGINFSMSGLTTQTWLTDNTNGLQKLLNNDPQQLYYIALGINDYTKINAGTYTLGDLTDINDEDYNLNADTFYGNYGKIIGNIKDHAPNAKIICLSMFGTSKGGATLLDPAIEEIAEHYNVGYIHVLDDPFFISPAWKDRLVHSHPIAISYAGMARAIRRLTERYVYVNIDYFHDYFGSTDN